jgi:uncharacterized protein YfaP (DUF2135 family)
MCEHNATQVNIAIPLTPYIEKGYKLRTVLSWKKENADLSLKSRFYRDKRIECKLDSLLERCGGAVHQSNNATGVEVIDLNGIGPYQYVFYLESYGKDAQSRLTESKAHINVYSGMLTESTVANLDVPLYDSQEAA